MSSQGSFVKTHRLPASSPTPSAVRPTSGFESQRMQRVQLEHLIRAAGDVLGETTVIIIGSQAILASVAQPPPAAARSIEGDILPVDDPDQAKADRIDARIGEASPFPEEFGVYAQGVSMGT